MRARFGILVVVLGLAISAVGCGAPPTADIDAAKAAISGATPAPTRPDLTVSAPTTSGTLVAGGSVTVSATTSNLGAGTAGTSATKVYLSTDGVVSAGDTVLATFNEPSLASRQSRSDSLQVTLPAGLTGTYYLLSKADANAVVTESNENNNLGGRLITISGATPAPSLSDLTVAAPTTSGTLVAGGSVTLSVTTSNSGAGAAGASATKVYLSADGVIGAGDTVLATFNEPSLASGQTRSDSLQVTLPAGLTGNYNLLAKADANGAVTESNESNNVGSRAITIAPASGGGGTGGFNITVDYSGSSTYQSYVDAAVQRWQQVITADLPDVASSTWGPVDDLRVAISIAPIDGAGGILGYAGYDAIRSGAAGLPYHGAITLDSSDVGTYTSLLTTIIAHEMGHILGIGTLWSSRGLTDGGYAYTGANALAEYRTLSGNPSAASLPLENTGGSGTARAHWRETTFGNEIMTGWIDNGSNPLSRMTIGSLKDLGYVVDMNQADPYSLPAASRSALATANAAAGIRSASGMEVRNSNLWVNSLGAGTLSLSNMDVLLASQSSAGTAADSRRSRGLLAHA